MHHLRDKTGKLVENRDFFIPPCTFSYPVGFNAPLGDPRRNIAIQFGMEKPEWLRLSDGEKMLKTCLFVLTECTNVTDRQTDTHTPHDDIGRAYA